MKATNKIRQNRYKPVKKPARTGPLILFRGMGIQMIIIMAVMVIISGGLIYIHDFIMQSDFFDIRKIEISGNNMASREELMERTDIGPDDNLYSVNLFKIKKQLISHPWVSSVKLRRELPDTILISVTEEEALAIITLQDHEKILINKQGVIFKEFVPDEDQHLNLPVINGLQIEQKGDVYGFDEAVFTYVMDILTTSADLDIQTVFAGINTGISIEVSDTFNLNAERNENMIQLKLGFGNYPEKIILAKKLSQYMQQHFTQKKICSMDLFDMENIFVKTKEEEDALHNNLKKGV